MLMDVAVVLARTSGPYLAEGLLMEVVTDSDSSESDVGNGSSESEEVEIIKPKKVKVVLDALTS